MPCYKPLKGYREGGTGKVRFGHNDSGAHALQVPCGRCIGCRLEYSRQWATRIMHESQGHQENAFLTLTYDQENLPYGGTLVPRHFTNFIKRYRKRLGPQRIRYFMCGEYGSQLSRPHYHAIIFGHDFPDKKIWRATETDQLYTSDELAELWPYGFSTIGSVTQESAGYVARYTTKKVNGDLAKDHYSRIVEETGELIQIQPEYARMSRRPGIGQNWFSQFQSDVFPWDEVIVNGTPTKPPRYYDKLLKELDPDSYESVIQKREEAQNSLTAKYERHPTRLEARETVRRAKIKTLGRTYETQNF